MIVIKKEGPTRAADLYSLLRERIINKENNLKSTSGSATQLTPEIHSNLHSSPLPQTKLDQNDADLHQTNTQQEQESSTKTKSISSKISPDVLVEKIQKHSNLSQKDRSDLKQKVNNRESRDLNSNNPLNNVTNNTKRRMPISTSAFCKNYFYFSLIMQPTAFAYRWSHRLLA